MQTLFRSEVVEQLLTLLYLDHDIAASGATVRQLAGRIGTSEATVSREVSRLVEAGAATDERVGNLRIVRPAPDGALAFHLAGLLRATVGPEVVLRRELAGRADVVRAVIFGSYAARASGEPGPPPGDIDLLLIGDISFEDGYDLAHAASRELSVEVNPVIRTVEEWERDDTGFAAEVRARPTIVLKGPSA
jgi:DNA-binding transcriptional ArsR family regulator